MRTSLCFQRFVTIISHNNPQILDCLCVFLTSLENSATIVLSYHTAVRLEHQVGGVKGSVPPEHLHTPDMPALGMALFNSDSCKCRGN